MDITLLVVEKVVSLFLIVAMGVAVVRCRLLKAEDSRVLSLASLYLITPCAILSAFQVPLTDEVRDGLTLAFAAAALLHVLFVAGCWLSGRFLGLDPLERTSVFYSNSANFIFPLVVGVLGREWMIYSLAFVCVQTTLLWTHAKCVLQERRNPDWRAVLLNINLIAIAAGIALFFSGIRFPGPVAGALASVGDTIGPVAMLITGMLIGSADWKRLLGFRRVWLVAFGRLAVVPVASCLALKYSGLASLSPYGHEVLMITLMATATPSATTIMNMSQIYRDDEVYASAINVVTTLLTIVAMPAVLFLYQW